MSRLPETQSQIEIDDCLSLHDLASLLSSELSAFILPEPTINNDDHHHLRKLPGHLENIFVTSHLKAPADATRRKSLNSAKDDDWSSKGSNRTLTTELTNTSQTLRKSHSFIIPC